MNILITGGAGYIGSHAVKKLREDGYRVVVLDTLEHGHRAAIGDATLIIGSTGDRALVEQILRREAIDAVLHFAAYKVAGESMEQPERYFKNNVSGTLSLLKAMAETGITRLVFSSTAAVYGTPAQLPVREDALLHPENVYGESKRMVEQMLRWFDQCYGLQSVSLRYFNAAGAAFDGTIGEDWSRAFNLVPRIIKAALGYAPPVQIFGTDYPTPDGTAIRDYIHVVDVVDAHIKALDYLAQTNTSVILNIGTGQGSSVQDVIDTTRRSTGIEVPIELLARRPGDPAAVWADTTLARQLLGWEPRYGIDDIIRTAWQWHSTHPRGYQQSPHE